MQNSIQHIKKGYLIHNVYCPTAKQTIEMCEAEFSMFQHQQRIYFEVPFEQFDAVQQHFGHPELVKKGAFSYKQVHHIAQTGNIHQLFIDEGGRIYFKEELLGMSSAISFAQSKWNGATRDKAVENAVITGLAIIGTEFAEEIVESQLQSAEISQQIQLSPNLRGVIAQKGSKAAVKKVASAATKKAMYSSAVAKKAITLLNANVVTGALVTGVMSSVDIVRAINGQMSPAQLFKNISKTAASVAGSIGGAMIGGGIGLNIPSVSTAVVSMIGGLVGLVIGSLLTTKIVKGILDLFIKDDAKQMLEIFNERLTMETQQYLLNEQELAQVLNDFNELYDMPQELRDMYAAEDRIAFADTLIEQELSRIVKLRMYLQIPTNQEFFEAIERLQ